MIRRWTIIGLAGLSLLGSGCLQTPNGWVFVPHPGDQNGERRPYLIGNPSENVSRPYLFDGLTGGQKTASVTTPLPPIQAQPLPQVVGATGANQTIQDYARPIPPQMVTWQQPSLLPPNPNQPSTLFPVPTSAAKDLGQVVKPIPNQLVNEVPMQPIPNHMPSAPAETVLVAPKMAEVKSKVDSDKKEPKLVPPTELVRVTPELENQLLDPNHKVIAPAWPRLQPKTVSNRPTENLPERPKARLDLSLPETKIPETPVSDDHKPAEVAATPTADLIIPAMPALTPKPKEVATATPTVGNDLPPLDLKPLAKLELPKTESAAVVESLPTPREWIPPKETPKDVEPKAPIQIQDLPPDSPLVQAVRAYQQGKPDEAVNIIKQLDPQNQEVLLYLMPLVVRMAEGKLNNMPPEEVAAFMDRLQGASGALKSKAALQTGVVQLCKKVIKFGQYEPITTEHSYRPSDVVELYVEVRNLTWEHQAKAARAFKMTLRTNLEVRDTSDRLVWRTDLRTVDQRNTPPVDYYLDYRFSLPELPPGNYRLKVVLTDEPTLRTTDRTVELRVAPRELGRGR